MKYDVYVHDDGRRLIASGVEVPAEEHAELKRTLLCSIFHGVILWY